MEFSKWLPPLFPPSPNFEAPRNGQPGIRYFALRLCPLSSRRRLLVAISRCPLVGVMRKGKEQPVLKKQGRVPQRILADDGPIDRVLMLYEVGPDFHITHHHVVTMVLRRSFLSDPAFP